MSDAKAPTESKLFKRVLAFAGLPFLSLITPFFFLPILARLAGADAWLAIAVGQSVGGFLALIVAFGYNTVGPTMVATAKPTNRPSILRDSILIRAVMFVPCAILGVAIAALIAPHNFRLEAALMSLAMVLAGLSSSWYMIGLGKAGLIVVYEILPRMLATVIAASVLILVRSVIWYPVLLIVATLLGVTWYFLQTVGSKGLKAQSYGDLKQLIKFNLPSMATELVAGAYNSLAVAFVSSTSVVTQAARYVSGDKLYRIAQYSASALGNALQGWVVEDDRSEFKARAKKALLLHSILGLFGFSCFAIFGPWLSELLFGRLVAIDGQTALAFGVATFAIAIGTALGRVILIGLGARNEFLLCVLMGASLGVPSIIVLSTLFGASGGAWGLAIGETASVTCQTFFVLTNWNRQRSISVDQNTAG